MKDSSSEWRSFRGARQPLEGVEAWPQSLKTAVSICLTTPFVAAVHWGPDLRILYNDAYVAALAERHPTALGKPFREVWPEIWDVLGPQLEQVLTTGRVFLIENQLLRLQRLGRIDDTYWTYSFAPIHGEAGQIAGVFVTAIDNTEKFLAERLREAETERQRRMFEQAPGFIVMLEGPDHRFVLANAAFRKLVGGRDLIGKSVAEALPDAVKQGFLTLLDQVFASGEALTLYKTKYAMQVAASDPVDERYVDFVYQPIVDEAGKITGIFVEGQDVTDQHRAESVLRESETRFRGMANNAPVMMWVTDATGHCIHLNARWYEFTDQEPGAGEGFGWLDAVHPADRVAAETAFVAANAQQRDYRVEFRLRRADGVYRWTIDAAAARFADDGTFLGYVGSVIDIDERREEERKLALSQEQLRLATDIGEIGEWDVDHLTGAMFWPPRVKAMFGISPDVPVTLDDFHDGVHPDDRAKTRTAYEAASDPQQRAFYDVEYRTVGKEDGVIRWVAAKGRGLFTAEGDCYRVIGTAIDVTARKAAEARLRELNLNLEAQVAERTAELRLQRDMIESNPSPILAFDRQYRVIAFNRAHEEEFRRVFGRQARIGEVLPELFPPDQATVLRGMMTRALGGESFTTVEAFGDPDLAKPYFEVSYYPLRDETEAVIGAFHHAKDISDRVRAEAELGATQEALRQAQKMEAMGQLTGGVAHDFNNLLTPIIGSLDMLLRRGIGSDRERRLMDGALQSAERAKTLVQRLLAFARRQPLQPDAVDLGALIAEMAELVGSTVGPNINVLVDVADDLPPASADRNQLEMALLNLCVNARDAMPGGGTLSISARRDAVRDGTARGLQLGHYVRLAVTDTGTGMSAETLARAIEPFFSTKGIGQGTGLGLSMVHGLAAQLGGVLDVKSELGHGTTVELWLPVSLAPIAVRDGTNSSELQRRSRGRVLLVDDEELVRMSTADMLVDMGFEVIEATSAEEALALLPTCPVDLVVTDHLMPGMSGADLAREVRATTSDLPILIVSGYAEAEGIPADMPRLTKPFRQAELADTLQQFDRLSQ